MMLLYNFKRNTKSPCIEISCPIEKAALVIGYRNNGQRPEEIKNPEGIRFKARRHVDFILEQTQAKWILIDGSSIFHSSVVDC